ncbi:hypothetical protein [Natrinema versiforme]|uniref:hypothetical protein n=1 Tax=Natrinema versiforme TaxID=88724 RepID=UPI0019310634|nr:hypothetical protein [Natrinema versiforme]
MPENPLRAYGSLLVLVAAITSGLVIASGFVAIDVVLDTITVWGYLGAVGVMVVCAFVGLAIDLRGTLEEEFFGADRPEPTPADGSTGSLLPLQYNVLLFLVPALIIPAFEVATGTAPADPSLGDLLVSPMILVVLFNVGYYGRTRRGSGGIVDERDVRNLDLALAVVGVVLLVSMVGLYGWYAVSDATVPREVDGLAAVGIVTVLLVLGATEIRQRI